MTQTRRTKCWLLLPDQWPWLATQHVPQGIDENVRGLVLDLSESLSVLHTHLKHDTFIYPSSCATHPLRDWLCFVSALQWRRPQRAHSRPDNLSSASHPAAVNSHRLKRAVQRLLVSLVSWFSYSVSLKYGFIGFTNQHILFYALKTNKKYSKLQTSSFYSCTVWFQWSSDSLFIIHD